MVNALRFKDEKKFFSQLSKFKIKFESFRDKGKEFSLLQIKAPDREQFYIASLSIGEKESIKKFNGYLKSINDRFKVLEKTKAKIILLFKGDLRVTSSLSSEENSSSEFSFESLKQKIRKCIDEPELIEETMQKILPKNSELARLCTEISQISTAFKKVNKTDADNEQTNLWNNDPNWLPLLTEEEQIKFGQSIFLHAMNANYSGAEKLTLAQIFLKQYVSQHELNQMTIELLTHRLSTLLIVEQIKKCEKLIQFLSQLTEGAVLPEHDPYELLEWLKVTRHTVNSVECWIRILVSPYCLSKYHIESLPTKLGSLLPYENTDELIEQYRVSHWEIIREKSEQLTQFPESFKTKIPPHERFQDDEQSKDSNRFTSLMSKLSKMPINELQALKREVLLKNRKDLNDGILLLAESN